MTAVALAGPSRRTVQILDNCDGPSFNAALGPGACARSGGLSFDEFLVALERGGCAVVALLARSAEARRRWNDHGGEPCGEFHTFTPVAAFGGGCVDELNGPLGLTPVAECAIPGIFGTTGAPPGASMTTAPLAAGIQRFQCLIHPWQRTTAEVG